MTKKKVVREPREFKAEFSQMRNDMYWEVHFFDGDLWYSFRWIGYDDANWWHNVASNQRRQTVAGETIDREKTDKKITLEIDFEKCIAREVL